MQAPGHVAGCGWLAAFAAEAYTVNDCYLSKTATTARKKTKTEIGLSKLVGLI